MIGAHFLKCPLIVHLDIINMLMITELENLPPLDCIKIEVK
jgi:hypothetical protein